MSDVVLNGISNLSGPGVFTQITLPGSQSGGFQSVYSVLLACNGLSTSQANSDATNNPGTFYGTNTLTPLSSFTDCQNLFLAGSPGLLGFSAFRAVNSTTQVYMVPIEQYSSGTAATQTITITGTPTVSGLVYYFVDGKPPVQCNYTAGSNPQTPSQIATALALAINQNQFLPVTAAPSGATVVVTAKTKNQRTNCLRGYAQVVGGSGITVSPVTPTFFTGGLGSDASIPGGGGYNQVFNALGQTTNRFYYVVPEAGFDSVDGYNAVQGSFSTGAVAYVQNYVDSQSQPKPGLRCRAIFGSNDTLANTQHTALDVDDVRLEAVWLPNADLTPFELACTWAACVTLTETVPLTAAGVNFDGFGSDPQSVNTWTVPAPLDGSSPSTTQLDSAIISGLTPVQVFTQSQSTAIYQRCTSYFYPIGQSAVLDLRVQDAGMVTICDRFFDTCQNNIAAVSARNVIGQDPAQGSPPVPPKVMTADNLTDIVVSTVNQFAAAYLINGPQTLATLQVVQNQNDVNSLGIRLTLFTANLLHRVLISGSGLPALVL